MVRQAAVLAAGLAIGAWGAFAEGAERNLYWGDTHLHTYNSPDAYLMQNRSTSPDDAYRFAKGEPIVHPYNRARIQLHTPLDFLVVSDHGEALGVLRKLFDGDARLTETAFGKFILAAAERGQEYQAFTQIVGMTNQTLREGDEFQSSFGDQIDTMRDVAVDVWHEIIDAAERHNAPGEFTTFIGWEWTSAPGGANLHRVVFTPDGPDVAKQFYPYSTLQSSAPEDLWNWLEKMTEQTGGRFISIPHNSNLSMGLMFDEVDFDGRPITADYARTRMKWEPIVEATQVKGDSESHPQLSPNDEFADYEFYQFLLDDDPESRAEGGEAGAYVRSALKRGLEIEGRVGVNPYKFGIIGSTDSHTGASTAEEDNFWGKMGLDSTPETKAEEVVSGGTGNDMGAAGIAAVWAEENTRDSLYEAFRRKEVYATTGPRLRVRFFGGWDYAAADADAKNLAEVGYAKGVPMGGDLANAPEGKAPTFLIHAVKDPIGANLDRVQVIKGFLNADGVAEERIYNVALSDDRVEQDGKVPPVGNTVDLKTAKWTNTIGDPQLATVWTDPDFDPAQRAFYYVRVLQIPTPRHTLYDAVALQRPHVEGHPPTIQERAYTSPIWYTPGG